MKITKKIIKVIIISFILILISSKIYGVRYSSDVSHPWYWEDGLYCSEPGQNLGVYFASVGWRSSAVEYSVEDLGNVNIEPSTGYAYYAARTMGLNNGDMQSVIWKSDRWGNSSNVKDNSVQALCSTGPLYQRATQYGNAYYGVLNSAVSGNKNFLKTTTNASVLKVLVDQNENAGTYTVGPYKLVLNVGSNSYTTNGARSLYKELNQTNAYFSDGTKFAEIEGISGINGTNIEFLNTNGDVIRFPNFVPGQEEEFYIRFKPNNGGAIVETGQPVITIKYLTKFKGNLKKYRAKKVYIKVETPTPTPTPTTPPSTTPTPDEPSPGTPEGSPPDQPIKVTFDTVQSIDSYLGSETRDITVCYIKVIPPNTSGGFQPSYKVVGVKGYYKPKYQMTLTGLLDLGLTRQTVYQKFMAQRKEWIDLTIGDTGSGSYDAAGRYIIGTYKEDEIYDYQSGHDIFWNENDGVSKAVHAWYAKLDEETETSKAPKSLGVYVAVAPSSFTVEKIISGDSVVIGGGDGKAPLMQQRNLFLKANYEKHLLNKKNNSAVISTDVGKTENAEYEKTADWQTTTTTYNDTTIVEMVQDCVKVSGNNVEETWTTKSLTLPGAPIDMEVGGKVWNDKGAVNGIIDSGEPGLAGIQVQLYELDDSSDSSPTLRATTITDNNGNYRFYGHNGNRVAIVNGLKKYYVQFTYNGQTYQHSYWKNDVSGTFSNAKEINREEYNKRFERIYSGDNNYKVGNTWHKSYAMKQKIRDDNGKFVKMDNSQNAMTYQDVYNKFLSLAKISTNLSNPTESAKLWDKTWDRGKNYNSVFGSGNNPANGTLKKWLADKGIKNDFNNIKTFINDTFIQSKTYGTASGQELYPKYNRFVIKNINKDDDLYKKDTPVIFKLEHNFTYLYSNKRDQTRGANQGLNERVKSELALQKDLYKTTLIINGKKQEYIYNKKAANIANDASWLPAKRADDRLYNGTTKYTRLVRASDFLFDSKDAYNDDGKKNLQVYVTYRITVKNRGKVNVDINEIADYYDPTEYTYGDDYSKENSYIGSDNFGGKKSGATIRIQNKETRNVGPKTISGTNYNYSTVYITGQNGEAIGRTYADNAANQYAYVYITFKVNNNNDRIRLDYKTDPLGTKVANLQVSLGKRNIAEINSYSTYYVDGQKIPNNYSGNNKNLDVSNKIAGIIDNASTPGNLDHNDLNANGDIITDSTNSKSIKDRQEPDTDKSPNLIIQIDNSQDDIRKITGFTYEDERNVENDKAVVGNGQYDNDETKVNGVTLELVELVQNVDKYGIGVGTYSKEKVWGEYVYDKNGKLKPVNNKRYSSGSGNKNIIINGPSETIFDVEYTLTAANQKEGLSYDDGAYIYKSIPAGDFYVRFKYGDTAETTMINTEKLNALDDERYTQERKDYIKEVNTLVPSITLDGEELKGRNAKSYNGQDYKSSVYQADIDQSNSNYGKYNGIDGFIRYDDPNAQNYTNENKETRVTSVIGANQKAKMYYYNIPKSEEKDGRSDAKDVWHYRNVCNEWSKGDESAIKDSLLNERAEILASFEKPATIQSDISEDDRAANQKEMITALMYNTKMIAQTGIINTEVEKDRITSVYNPDNQDDLKYTLKNVDFGVVERPEAALRLNKEIVNIQIRTSNNRVLFDTSTSERNIYFSKHQAHEVNWDSRFNKIRNVVVNANNGNETPELIQSYIDDELLHSASVVVRYKITVTNSGEVDYKDKQFYYTGKTNNADVSNISKTNAVQVVDYVPNTIKFNQVDQDKEDVWNIRPPEYLMESLNKEDEDIVNAPKDFVNREYKIQLKSYEVLITSNDLSEDLTPETSGKGNSSKETALVLATKTTANNEINNLVYNNLIELIQTKNELGRRMVYSTAGNQEMANQHLGNNTTRGIYTNTDRVIPKEIDADSSQKVVILPPTGMEDNSIIIINITIIIVIILMVVVIILKKLSQKNKEEL